MKFCSFWLSLVGCFKLSIKLSTFILISFVVAACGSGSSKSASSSSDTGTAENTSVDLILSSPESVPDIRGIQLVSAPEHTVLQDLSQDSTVDLNGLPSSFNFVILSSDSSATGSVGIEMSGCESLVRAENYAPYTVASESSNFDSLAIGECSVVATPYQGANLTGDAGTPFTINFSVIDSSVVTINAAAANVADITRIDLVDAADLDVIQTVSDNDTIDLNGLPSLFNFVVRSSDEDITGSVKIDMSGCTALDRYENHPPYTVAVEGADLAVLSTGECTITARAYESADIEGDAGEAYRVDFNVIDTTPEPVEAPVQNVAPVAVEEPPVPVIAEATIDEAPQAVNAVVNSTAINPVITPSRVSCASPCTVVFSAEKTTADGLDSHGIWSRLSYYWDFDTGVSSTYGHLYQQAYTYFPDASTASEAGHIPMVTKTFLCEAGECTYNVRMRVRNASNEESETSQLITVKSESVQWSPQNTICVSNSLNVSADWSETVFDKGCPEGATKQNTMPFADQYHQKLVLLKKGDSFDQNVATYPDQSGFKIGVFGDENESRPQIHGEILVGVTNIASPTNAPSAANYLKVSDAVVQQYGWPSNIYFEGLHLSQFYFPMSYQHIGLHDIDMDRSNYDSGGYINVASGADICHLDRIDCNLVPFPKGAYLSAIKIVGSSVSKPGVNIVHTACPMINYMGIADISVRNATEHNLRIAGWYRINIMRSLFQGQHEFPGKSKITLRSCLRSGGSWEGGVWDGHSALASSWNDDVEGRTRMDAWATDGSVEYAHASRYQVIAYNQLGDPTSPLGENRGGLFYSSNTVAGDELLKQDVILSHNTFLTDFGEVESNNILEAYWATCIGNTYSGIESCLPLSLPEEMVYQNEPEQISIPSAPGS